MGFIYFGLLALGLLALGVTLTARLDFFRNSVSWRLTYPFFQPGSEGLILSEVNLIRAGGSIYTPFQADSFISAPYPPLYYYLTAWLGSGTNSPFEGGRWISLVAALTSALLIAGLVYLSLPTLKGRPKWMIAATLVIAIASGLLFLSLPAVTVWAARVRADMLMVALQLTGLLLMALMARTGRGWLAFAAIIPFTLAFYTKQTALAGPFAAAGFIVWHYRTRWRFILVWAIAFGLAIGLPFIVLNLATGNEFYRRLFKYHNLPWLSSNFETYATLFLQENAALLGLGLVGWTLKIENRKSKIENQRLGVEDEMSAQLSSPQSSAVLSPQPSLLLLYFLASLGLLFGLGVAGADHNHFLPAEAAVCIVAGVATCRALLLPGRWRWLVLPALALLWAQAAFFSVPADRYEIEFRQRPEDYKRQMAQIIAYTAARPGPILTSEAGFFVLTGKNNQPDYYNDLFTLAALNQQQLYSNAGLLERIRRKEFAVVLTEGDLFTQQVRPDVWTPELLSALEANYYRKFADVWYIYEPKGS